jgi:tetraacyldisaccharide 4'-kinase
VLPRGLLREPLSGLSRADAFLITRCSLAPAKAVEEIDAFLKSRYPDIPIYHCNHVHSGLWILASNQTISMESLTGQKVFLTAGIGDPTAFARQIESAGAIIIGTRWFADHHNFTAAEIESLINAAKQAGADRLITTEKDWVKIQSDLSGLMAVVKMEIQFHAMDGKQLLEQISNRAVLNLRG